MLLETPSFSRYNKTMRKKNVLINCINLIFGISLLFLLLTDIELNSTIANFAFPMCILGFGFFSYKKFTDKQKGKIFFYLPSFIGGFGFYGILLLMLLLLFPLSFLGGIFWLTEECAKERIQRIYSPNKIEYCDVYHYPVGAYSGGTGRVRVFLVNKACPIIRREVFYEGTAYICIEDEHDIPYEYCVWKDADNIIIFPHGNSIVVNVRGIVFLPAAVIKYFMRR